MQREGDEQRERERERESERMDGVPEWMFSTAEAVFKKRTAAKMT